MSVIIKCKKEGFRRCGMAHPALAEYPDDRFTPDEILRFQKDAMFEIEIISGKAVVEETTNKKGKRRK